MLKFKSDNSGKSLIKKFKDYVKSLCTRKNGIKGGALLSSLSLLAAGIGSFSLFDDSPSAMHPDGAGGAMIKINDKLNHLVTFWNVPADSIESFEKAM